MGIPYYKINKLLAERDKNFLYLYLYYYLAMCLYIWGLHIHVKNLELKIFPLISLKTAEFFYLLY